MTRLITAIAFALVYRPRSASADATQHAVLATGCSLMVCKV
jgi:hypothetical protein